MAKTNRKMIVLWGMNYSAWENTFFFDGDTIVSAVSGNDAEWRHEYFDPILKHFGLEVSGKIIATTAQVKAMEVWAKENGCWEDYEE